MLVDASLVGCEVRPVSHRGTWVGAGAALLVSTREAWADNNEWSFLTTADLIKLGAIALVLLVLVVVVVWGIATRATKFVVDVRREIKNAPQLPEARVHRDDRTPPA